ncbi:MAG TPA: GerMN domain-containing protein [Candidatus Baltobacteraceae bacterium]|nr:GerMN domain-containing protein [Candidatus Baltobacteraceae bacterium]
MLSAVGLEIWPWVSGVALAPPPRTPVPLAAPAAPGRVRVRIFLPDEARQVLREEEREIVGWLTLQDGVQHLLAQLAIAQAGARPPLPPGTTLQHAYLDDAGILYLDFNASIQQLAGGDWMKADLASSAIGLTLAANLGEVKRIQFLSDGTELTLLSGGVDFRRPFIPRFPGEEAAAEATQR